MFRHKFIRAHYKIKYAHELDALKKTGAWAECVMRLGLNDFEFIIAQPQHRDRLVDLCTETFAQSNPFWALFGMTGSSANDKELSSEEFRFLLEESGSSVIAIHSKSGAIAGHSCTKDVCDMEHLSLAVEKGSSHKYVADLMSQLHKNVTNGDTIEYGKRGWAGRGFVAGPFQGTAVFAALFLLNVILPYRMGYESLFGEAFHVQVSRIAQCFGAKIVNKLDLNKVRFEDGKTMRGFIEKSTMSKRALSSLCVELSQQNLRTVFQTDKYSDRAVDNFLRRQSNLLMRKAKL